MSLQWLGNLFAPEKQARTLEQKQSPQECAKSHQSSLEGVIDFSAAAQPLFANAQERTQAIGRFRRIVEYFEAVEPPASRRNAKYNRPALIRLTFEYARSPESQDRFLRAFFRSLALGMLDDSVNLSDDSVVADFRELLFGFADPCRQYICLLMGLLGPTSLLGDPARCL